MAPLDGIDLNLLVTLHVLLREESVTRAAAELGTTQPTVSRALATLRDAFGDPLLIRTGHGMAPTAFGRSLETPLERLLAGINRLKGVGAFDPSTTERQFRMIVPDVLGCALLSKLRHALTPYAGLGVNVLGAEGSALPALLGNRTDLVVGVPQVDHADLYTKSLPTPLPWSIVFGPKHPRWRGRMTYKAWLGSEHVQLLPAGQPTIGSELDALLQSRSESRNVRLRIAYVSGLADVLETTPMVASLPTPTANWVAHKRRLRVEPHVLKAIEPIFARMTWHAAQHHDEGHRWFRALVSDALLASIQDKRSGSTSRRAQSSRSSRRFR